MARGGEMQVVELDDVPEVVPDQVDDRPRRVRWRRPMVVVGVVALVGAALAGGQWVVDARERSAIAALAGIPGVIAPIDGDLRVLGTVTPAELGDQFGGSGEVTSATDGSQAYQWYDPASGATLWTAPLLGPTPQLAHDEGDDQSIRFATYCQLGEHADEDDDTSPASRVICLVSDGGEQDGGDWMGTPLPVTTTRLVVLDTEDGSVVTDRSIDGGRTVAVAPGLAIVADLVDSAPVVTAYDLATGAQVWQRVLPVPTMTAEDTDIGWHDAFVNAIGRRIVVQSPVNRFTLLADDGRVLRDVDAGERGGIDGWWVDASTHRFIYSTSGGGGASTPTLVIDDADPSKDRPLIGSQLYIATDDGSVPGLVLTGGRKLWAWDAASGKESWSTDDGLASDIGQAMVLRGDVIVTSSNVLAAFDGSTGRHRWTHALDATTTVTNLFTDGRNVYVELQTADGELPVLIGYDRTTGDEALHQAYPAGIDGVYPALDGRLIGHDPATDRYVVIG